MLSTKRLFFLTSNPSCWIIVPYFSGAGYFRKNFYFVSHIAQVPQKVPVMKCAELPALHCHRLISSIYFILFSFLSLLQGVKSIRKNGHLFL